MLTDFPTGEMWWWGFSRPLREGRLSARVAAPTVEDALQRLINDDNIWAGASVQIMPMRVWARETIEIRATLWAHEERALRARQIRKHREKVRSLWAKFERVCESA